MERSRFLLALVLCFALTIVWFRVSAWLWPPEEPPVEDQAQEDQDKKEDGEVAKPPDGGENGGGKEQPAPAPDPNDSPRLAAGEGATHEVETEHLRMVWSERGGALVSLKLKDHRDAVKDDALELVREVAGRYPAFVVREIDSDLDLPVRRWAKSDESDDTKLVLECRVRGLVLTKEIVHAGEGTGPTLFFIRLVAKNVGPTRGHWRFWLYGPPGILRETGDEDFVRGHLAECKDAEDLYTLDVESLDLDDLEDYEKEGSSSPNKGPFSWTGVDNKYFAVCLAVAKPGEMIVSASGNVSDLSFEAPPPGEEAGDVEQNARPRIELEKLGLDPEKEASVEFEIHVGPKDDLDDDPRFAELTDYFASSISKILIWILRVFQGWVGSWGVAIVLLTIAVKGVLFPITRKQQRSMHKFQQKMKKFQPKLTAIRERYKDDRQKMNEEIMTLYRTHGVNPIPLGGCLPIFLQIPIFIGLYNALRYVVDLRLAPFLWIDDLSQPDRLWLFPGGFRMPFFGWEAFNLLPVLMIFSWYYQQKLQPKSEDPQIRQQQKMMQIMPIIFGVMFYTMPSGLVLYWLTSTFLGIFEQLVIKRGLKDDDASEPEKKEGAGGGGTGPLFPKKIGKDKHRK